MSSLRNKSWNLSLTKLEAFEKTFHNKPIHVKLYIPNGIFLKVMRVKGVKRQTFLKAEKLQNHSNEGKGGRKRKSEEKERREREKGNGCTLRPLPENNCWTEKGPFGDNVLKNLARYIIILNNSYMLWLIFYIR